MINRYILGAGAGLLALLALLYWRLDSVAAERDKWREDARGKAAVIDTLQNEAARSEAILTELRENRARIEETHRQSLQRLSDLEASNEEVRDWLRQHLPDDVVSLLYGEDRDDTPVTAERDDAAVQGGASPKASTGNR